jgi:hypothetical protein
MCEPIGTQDCCAVHVVHCGPPGHVCCGVPRRFATKKEKHEALKKYRDHLQHELEGVEERIKDLSEK